MKAQIYESALIEGNLSKLSSEERLSYYKELCTSLGLNPLTKPFEYITLNGKLTLYARKDCTDQLRNSRGVSLVVNSTQKIEDVYIVTVTATLSNGRNDSSTGVVSVAGLKGDALANAFMKAETKAKRRVTLSICGLGMLDETEIESIPSNDLKIVKPVVNAIESKVTITTEYAESKLLEYAKQGDKKSVISFFKTLTDSMKESISDEVKATVKSLVSQPTTGEVNV